VRVPDLPDPFPDPLEQVWHAGTPIIRCHDISMGATEFNPTSTSRRFRPVDGGGLTVPTIYGAELSEGALSETVFHDVPVRRTTKRRVQRKALVSVVLSIVISKRNLRLAKLHGDGLKRLGVTHGELIESSSKQYPRTAIWAQAIYNHSAEYDGMIWRSRQHQDSYAIMLWEGRVDRFNDLEPDQANPPLVLYMGEGFDQVQELADKMDITVVI
jgi:hypothetical protein